MTTKTDPVPLPAGATSADTWQDDNPPNRVLFAELHTIDGRRGARVSVQATAVQLADGRIDDGNVSSPRRYMSATTGYPLRRRGPWPPR
jgi:hypothetical protein